MFIADASTTPSQLIMSNSPLEPIISVSHPTHSSRKRRTRLAKAANDSTLDAQGASSDSCVPKAKRGRQAKLSASTGESYDSSVVHWMNKHVFIEGLSVHQPRNQLATEILENLAKFPHCILLTRVGQFYEVSVLAPPSKPPYDIIRMRSRTLTKRLKLRDF